MCDRENGSTFLHHRKSTARFQKTCSRRRWCKPNVRHAPSTCHHAVFLRSCFFVDLYVLMCLVGVVCHGCVGTAQTGRYPAIVTSDVFAVWAAISEFQGYLQERDRVLESLCTQQLLLLHNYSLIVQAVQQLATYTRLLGVPVTKLN
jgi:hypothetical protein